MMHRVEKALAALAIATLGFVAAPCDAAADDDWSMTLLPQYGARIGGAPGGPTGLDSRGIEKDLHFIQILDLFGRGRLARLVVDDTQGAGAILAAIDAVHRSAQNDVGGMAGEFR